MAPTTRLYLNRIVGGVSACLLLAAAVAGMGSAGGAGIGNAKRASAARPEASQPDPLAPPTNGPRKADATWQTLLNATVHVKPGQVLEHATVVLRDGKIVSVKGTPVPGGEVALTAAAVKEAKAEEERAKQPKTGEAGEKKPGETPEKSASGEDRRRTVETPKTEAMAPAGPDGARTWDCRGLHVYAGWIDPYVEVDSPRPAADAPGQHWNARVTPQRSALDGKGLDAGTAESLRKLGYTAVAISPKGGIFRGSSAVVSLAKPDNDRAAAKPPVYAERVYQSVAFDLSSVSGGGRAESADNAGSNWSGYPDSQMGAIALIRQTLMDADWQTAARASGSYREERNALDPLSKAGVATGGSASNGGAGSGGGGEMGSVPLLFNTDDELEIFRAVKIAAEAERPMLLLGCGTEFRRIDGIRDVLKSKEAASLTPKHSATESSVPLIVPLNFPEPPKVGSLGQADAVELRDLMTWEQAPTNPRRLQQAGLDVSLTTSKLKDRAKFRDNMRKAIKYGLSEDDALAMVTTRPASLLGVDSLMGTVEEGKVANLIVSDGPMFIKKTQIRDVWVDGKRHEVNPPPATKLKGEWEVTFEPEPKLAEGVTKMRVTFSIDKDNAITIRKRSTKADGIEEVAKATARNVRVEGTGDTGRVQFVFDHDPFGELGVFVNAGLIEDQGKTIHGDATRSNGARFNWTAKKIAEEPVSDADATPKGFAGTWKVVELDGKAFEQPNADAANVTGLVIDKENVVTLTGSNETHKADTVKIEGNKITITLKGTYWGEATDISIIGTLTGDSISSEERDTADGTKRLVKYTLVATKPDEKPKPQPGDKKPEVAPDAKPADPLTGTWTGTGSSPQMSEPVAITLKLTMKDATVTGTFSIPAGAMDVADMAFVKSGEDSGKLTFRATPVGGRTSIVSLDVAGNTMTGTAKTGPMSMNITLTREGAAAVAVKPGEAAAAGEDDEEMPKDIPEKITYPFGPYASEALPKQETVLFNNAVIWTCGPQGVIRGGWLMVENGKITGIGEGKVEAGPGMTVVDCAGKQITPGLIDCHSHTGISRGVNESGQAVTAEVRIQDVTDPDAMSWYWQLAGGITTVNNLHGSANPIGGQNCVNKNRWGSMVPDDLHFAGAIAGIKFALGENVKQSNWGDNFNTRYPKTRMGVETLIRDRFVAAKEYSARRKAILDQNYPAKPNVWPSDWEAHIASWQRLKLQEAGFRMDLELEALAEILRGERLVHCHSYRQDEILMLCRIAKEFNFKIGTFQHILEGYKVADEIRDNSGGGSAFSDWWGYKVEVQDAIPYDGAIMHDVGVTVSFNSDSDELARRMNVEAAKAVKYGGLSPEEALKFVTINPAKQLHIDRQVGSLEVGKDADLAIWTVPALGGPTVPAGSSASSSASRGAGVSPASSSGTSKEAGGTPAPQEQRYTVDGTPLSAFARCDQTWVDGRCYFSTERDIAMREANTKDRNRILQKLLATGSKKKDAGKGDEPKPSGDAPPGGRRRRPTDDLAAGSSNTDIDNGASDVDGIVDDDNSSNGQASLLQRMLKRSADTRREYYLNMWRMGIDPTYSRCGDCGESNAGALR